MKDLKQLIYSCGKNFNRLERDEDSKTGETIWTAYMWTVDKGHQAKTPEEAVELLLKRLEGE